MPVYTPTPMWKDEEVFIIGGGPSLKGFDWSLLLHEKTIGCNNAFRLGADICDVCVFVDRQFIFDGPNHPRKGYYDKLAEFPNLIVTNDTQLKLSPEPWIKWMPRKPKGLHFDALGFNANCGASAINLALLFGASTVYLLGFDMHLSKEGRPNFHEYVINKPSEEVYIRMLASFGHVSRDLKDKFPGKSVYNVTNNSNLNVFPKLNADEFWEERRQRNGRSTATTIGPSSTDGRDSDSVDSRFGANAKADSVPQKAAG